MYAGRSPLAAERPVDSALGQISGNRTKRIPVDNALKNLAHNSGFVRVYLNFNPRYAVAEQEAELHQLPLFKALPYAPLLVFAGGQAFLLRIGSQNGHHQFALGAHGVDVLFLKVDVHAQTF
ncbi:hypothetical protein SDC9_200832 [bioreactor metagenome]|uniref:Uncharacterized protein n=1 Tax=bioreactor metagenome TaxID=1076179 RepID=A0A645IPA6_9ZZZZ